VDVSPITGGIVEVSEAALSSYPETLSIDSGASIQVKAIPASGYRFDYWDGDLSGITNPSTILVDCNKEITANFSRIVVYSLSIQTSGSGSITSEGNNHSYEEGTIVSITATPDSGWQFDGWSGDVADPNIATTTITMTSDITVNANFSRIPVYSLKMQVNGRGFITPASGSHGYEEGTMVSITANPDSGWQFDGWSGDVADPNLATTTVILNSNKTISANFLKVNTSWWLFISIVVGVIIIGLVVWLILRNRTA
jgi:uncharacterized repeat protein (TIGR02543 family)